MKYKSILVDTEGKRVTNRNMRKSERTKVYLYNKKLTAVLRKERKQARIDAAEAIETVQE